MKKIPPELRFHDRLLTLRVVEAHISQMRHGSDQSRSTLGAIRKLAVAISVSADMLLSVNDERGPDDDLKLPFEAALWLDPEEKNVIRPVIASIVLRNTVKAADRRFTTADSGGTRP